ncbi:MAG TPA: hypothetical protein VGQ83_06815 [Polyangia bacterium]
MSRLAATLLSLAALGAGCSPPPQVVRPESLRPTVPGATALVVVYSRTGYTAEVARAFAQVLGADFLRLQGRGDEGGSWFSTPSWTSRVPVTPARIDLRPYRLVLIGGPIWYWRPNALTTSFIDAADLRGRDVVLFHTNEGGAMSARTVAAWQAIVAARGGRVRDVVGINRKQLPAGVSLAEAAARLAQARRAAWER